MISFPLVYQNDQFWFLFVDLIIKNPNFYWYLAIFLSEAVEASQFYFFGNRLIKPKCPNLLNVLLATFLKNLGQFMLAIWDFKV